jgi:hypothetical protein
VAQREKDIQEAQEREKKALEEKRKAQELDKKLEAKRHLAERFAVILGPGTSSAPSVVPSSPPSSSSDGKEEKVDKEADEDVKWLCASNGCASIQTWGSEKPDYPCSKCGKILWYKEGTDPPKPAVSTEPKLTALQSEFVPLQTTITNNLIAIQTQVQILTKGKKQKPLGTLELPAKHYDRLRPACQLLQKLASGAYPFDILDLDALGPKNEKFHQQIVSTIKAADEFVQAILAILGDDSCNLGLIKTGLLDVILGSATGKACITSAGGDFERWFSNGNLKRGE